MPACSPGGEAGSGSGPLHPVPDVQEVLPQELCLQESSLCREAQKRTGEEQRREESGGWLGGRWFSCWPGNVCSGALRRALVLRESFRGK